MTLTSVREAGLSDVEQLISWGRAFHAISPWRHASYDADAVRQIITDAIEVDHATVFMHDKGAIGGVVTPLWLAPEYKIAKELFWYSGGGGKELLDAFEEWAERLGANEIMMSGLDELGEKPKEIYRKRGYSPIEYSYVKRF